MAKERQQIKGLEVLDVASEGMGVARHEGMVIFIDHTLPGDVVDVEVYRKKSGFRMARPLAFLARSNKRTNPVCEHFGTCGGCKWQNLQYEEQLRYKSKWVHDALKRIGKLEFPEPLPIIGSPDPYYYRNKLEYTFSDLGWLTGEEIKSSASFTNRAALGFHIPGRFDKVLNIQNCYLQADPGNRIRLFVREKALDKGLEFFNLVKQTGIVRTLLQRNNRAGEWMVCLVVTEYNSQVEELLEELQQAFPQIVSLQYAVNTKRNDSLEGIEPVVFKGTDHLLEQMEGLQFRIGLKSFYQTNPVQAETLYKVTREYAALTGRENVYDLYTGTGTIALFVSSKAAKVTGIEYVEAAVRDANENARINGILNSTFMAGDMKDLLVPELFSTHGAPDVIITDPPRAGMHEAVVERIRLSGARRIVYVSCNPSTQARDLALLDEIYRIDAVQPVDMFPQTTHVENVVKLSLR